MSTRDLIDAIYSGDSVAVKSAFEQAISSRIADRLDTMRQDVAKNMFKGSVSESVEQIDELKSSTLKRYVNKAEDSYNKASDAKTKAKRDAGMERADRKLEDKANSRNPFKEEVELDEADELMGREGINRVNKKPRPGQTNLRNIPAGNHPNSQNKYSDDTRDAQPQRLKSAIKGSLGKHTKPNLPEEVELDEASGQPKAPKDNEIHVKHVDGKYHVHAVGKDFAHGIKAGEHLSDTELDDFQEMGGKIKHVK